MIRVREKTQQNKLKLGFLSDMCTRTCVLVANKAPETQPRSFEPCQTGKSCSGCKGSGLGGVIQPSRQDTQWFRTLSVSRKHPLHGKVGTAQRCSVFSPGLHRELPACVSREALAHALVL